VQRFGTVARLVATVPVVARALVSGALVDHKYLVDQRTPPPPQMNNEPVLVSYDLWFVLLVFGRVNYVLYPES
jgi:hypothetical protein